MALVASFEYSGFGDYWGGNGRRWDDDAGCLFAYYGRNATVRDIVDELCNDFHCGGDFEGKPLFDEYSEDDVRAALLDMLSDSGREDYNLGVIYDGSVDYAEANGLDVCRECGQKVGKAHRLDCDIRTQYTGSPDKTVLVAWEDCVEDDDCMESPAVIVLLEIIDDEDSTG